MVCHVSGCVCTRLWQWQNKRKEIRLKYFLFQKRGAPGVLAMERRQIQLSANTLKPLCGCRTFTKPQIIIGPCFGTRDPPPPFPPHRKVGFTVSVQINLSLSLTLSGFLVSISPSPPPLLPFPLFLSPFPLFLPLPCFSFCHYSSLFLTPPPSIFPLL